VRWPGKGTEGPRVIGRFSEDPTPLQGEEDAGGSAAAFCGRMEVKRSAEEAQNLSGGPGGRCGFSD
jgi:hypothetical protein